MHLIFDGSSETGISFLIIVPFMVSSTNTLPQSMNARSSIFFISIWQPDGFYKFLQMLWQGKQPCAVATLDKNQAVVLRVVLQVCLDRFHVGEGE